MKSQHAILIFLGCCVVGGLSGCLQAGGGGRDAGENQDVYMMVVPPGAQGNAGSGGQGANPPANFDDQLHLYEELAFAPEGFTGSAADCMNPADAGEMAARVADPGQQRDVCTYFKGAGLTAPQGADCQTITNPRTGNDVSVCYDGWGVPYVDGPTREDAMYGFGYAGASIRLWLFDVLRYIGRGRLSELLGPADDTFDFDKDMAGVAGYNEFEISEMVVSTGGRWPFPVTDSQWASDSPEAGIGLASPQHVCHPDSEPAGRDPETYPDPNDDPAYGKFGLGSKLVICDLDSMVAGMNAFIAEGNNGAPHSLVTQADYALTVGLAAPQSRMPTCLSASDCSTVPGLNTGFTRNDIVASAILIQATFAFGGGSEASNLRTLQALDPGLSDASRSPTAQACALWRDLRHATDATTPKTDAANAVGARQSPAVIPESCEAPWPTGHAALPAGAAIWDAGSYQAREVFRHTPVLFAKQLTRELPAAQRARIAGLDSLTALFNLPVGERRALVDALATRLRDAAQDPARLQRPEQPVPVMLALSDEPLEATHRSLARAGFPMPRLMSNFIGVTGSQTESGQPIAVMGPQTGYFLPQLLWEVAIVSGGQDPGPFDFAGRGVVFGQLPYINIGRGIDYAWSATSGSSDLVDTRVSRLCLLPGGPLATALPAGPSRDDAFNNDSGAPGADGFPDFDGYLFDAGDGMQCRPVYRRQDQFTASGTAASAALGSQSVAETVDVFVMRTHYGPIVATATVGGAPVAVSAQRSTYFAELDTAPPFALATARVIGHRGSGNAQVQDFYEVFNGVTGTFNWQYIQKDNLAFFHSGLYPQRPAAQHPELPVWGDGRYDWAGARVDLAGDPGFFDRVASNDPQRNYYPNLARPVARRNITSTSVLPGAQIPVYFEYSGFLSLADHPRVNNPPVGHLHSWNNSPAANWWAADGNGSYGPVHRANMLVDRLQAFQASGRKHTLGTMVEIMSDAAHTDLIGMRVAPLATEILRTTPASADLSAYPAIGSRAVLDEMITFVETWANDGSLDWMVGEGTPGLGGYRRTRRDGSQDPARTDGDGADVSFEYSYRAQATLMDAWYPEMVDHTLLQFREIAEAGGSLLNGFWDKPGAIGSAYQSGWFFTLQRSFAQALDAALGGNRAGAGSYRAIRCGASLAAPAASFADCRDGLLQSLNDAVAALGGWESRAAWDGTQLYGRTVENEDAVRHTAISAQTMDAMHWYNRPTYQGVFQIFHSRQELETDP